jgi:hypothetical protein
MRWLVLLVVFGCSTKPQPRHEASPWLEDLHALADELPKRHVDPWFHTTEAAWRAEVKRLETVMPGQNDAQNTMALSHLVAMIGDGHTRLQLQIHSYPLRLYDFADGLYVIGAHDTSLVGARLASIGGQPIGDVRDRLLSVVPHENAAGDRENLTYLAIHPDVLAGLGLAPDTSHATYGLVLADGTTRAITLEPSLAKIPVSPPKAIPLYIERPQDNYWLKTEAGLVYVKYNACAPGEPPLPAFFDEVLHALDADPEAKVVIDVRHNAGGNSALLDPLIAHLADRKLAGRLYCVIGRKTFSSGLLNALSLARAGATLAGEPTAGKPSHHGEVKMFPLPRSGLIVTYSTKIFEDPNHKGDSLVPDLVAETTYADWAAGRDPVLDAILKR